MDEPVKVQLPTSLAGQLMDDDELENDMEGLPLQRRDRRAKTEPSQRSVEPLKIDTPGQGTPATTGQELPPGELPSVGSELHGTGTCKPCAWFWKANGCQNGKECRHCHMCPEGEIKARRKAKSTMMSIGLASPKGKLTSVAAQRCWGMEGPVTVELKPPAGAQTSPRDTGKGCNDAAAAGAAAAASTVAAAAGKGRRRIGSSVGLADKDAIIGLPAQMRAQAQPAKAEVEVSTSLRFESTASSGEPVKLAWGAGSDASQQSQPASRSTRSPSPREAAAPAPAPPPGLHPVQPMLPRQACVPPQAGLSAAVGLPPVTALPHAPGLQPNAGLPHNVVLPPTPALHAAHLTLGAGILRRDSRLKTEPVKVLWNEDLDAFQPYEKEGTAAQESVPKPPPQMLPLKMRTPLDLSSLLDDLSPTSIKSLGEASLGAASNDGGLTAAERASALLKATAASSAAVPPPGLQVPAGMASHGSVLHGTGQCKPCAWFWKPKGCNNGKECRHCHACPEDEIKNRKKARATMMRLGLSSPKSGNAGGAAPAMGEVSDEQDAALPTTAAMPSVMTAAPAPEAAGLVENNDGLVMASGSCGNLGLQIDQESTCVSGSEHELTNSSSEEEALLVQPAAA